MRIALDATYSIGPQPSGIGVYSHEILDGLVRSYPQNEYYFCYRWKQWRQHRGTVPANVRRRLLQPPLPTFRAGLFHALNQRVDRRPAPKVVSTFHDLFVMTGDYSSPEFQQRFSRQAKRAAENSDMIIAVSQFTANQVSTLLGFPRSSIRIVPHGVHLPATTVETNDGNKEKIILSVGTLQKRKNTVGLVEAFEGLPQQWRLVLAGAPTGFGAQEILRRIENSRSRERIEVTGYIHEKDLRALYSRASIFAFPSWDEGFGIPVLEAMAHGLPVVASNTSALPEVTGQAALLVDPRQPEALRAALWSFIQNEELRERFSREGLARAGEFSWERSVRGTYRVYEELFSQTRG